MRRRGSNLLDSKSQMQGTRDTAAVAYFTKENPKIAENPLLIHTVQ